MNFYVTDVRHDYFVCTRFPFDLNAPLPLSHLQHANRDIELLHSDFLYVDEASSGRVYNEGIKNNNIPRYVFFS